MHAEYTIRAAKAGKHVMCEKPMATSVAECEAMIAACKTAGRKLMIGYRCHFEPTNLEAMRLARSGRGRQDPLCRSEHGFVQGDPSKWRLKKALAGGGSLMDMGVYSLQAARYMTGEEPIAVTARESTDRTDPRFTEVEDMIEWLLKFPSGAIASCLSTYSANQNHVLLMGDKGGSSWSPPPAMTATACGPARTAARSGDRPAAGPGQDPVRRPTGSPGRLHSADRSPIVSGEEGLRDMRIIEAIYRSARVGSTVKL
jgi:predicted dehydrogenase